MVFLPQLGPGLAVSSLEPAKGEGRFKNLLIFEVIRRLRALRASALGKAWGTAFLEGYEHRSCRAHCQCRCLQDGDLLLFSRLRRSLLQCPLPQAELRSGVQTRWRRTGFRALSGKRLEVTRPGLLFARGCSTNLLSSVCVCVWH